MLLCPNLLHHYYKLNKSCVNQIIRRVLLDFLIYSPLPSLYTLCKLSLPFRSQKLKVKMFPRIFLLFLHSLLGGLVWLASDSSDAGRLKFHHRQPKFAMITKIFFFIRYPIFIRKCMMTCHPPKISHMKEGIYHDQVKR